MDFENEDFTIDETSIDKEWLRQSSLVWQYSKELATIKRLLEVAETQGDQLRATLDKDIRSNPESYGIPKVTEGAISITIILQPEIKEKQLEISKFKKELDLAYGALKSLEHKKSALENLVKLNGQNYFAGPSTPLDISRETIREKNQKDSNAKVQVKRGKTYGN